MPKYSIRPDENARDDLRTFRKFEQKLILDSIDEQLAYEPTVKTNNRKQLEPNDLAGWELRIGNFRVFYDVDEANLSVRIIAVGCKIHNKLLFRGREFKL